MMYTLFALNQMLSDEYSERVDTYANALSLLVPGKTVVDLGSGFGYFSLFALKHGASKVYSIEVSDMLEIGRDLYQRSSLAGEIVFIRADSSSVSLPERVDVLIADLRGNLPFYGRSIETIIDARERFLKSDGVMISEKDVLFGRLVSDERMHQKFGASLRRVAELTDTSDLLERSFNTGVAYSKYKSEESRLISKPTLLGEVDYRTVASPDFTFETEFEADSDELAHGFLVWFDSQVYQHLSFSNAPDRTNSLYGQLFFPFSKPLKLRAGEKVAVRGRIDLLGESYVISWWTEHRSERFEQSTFFSRRLGRQLRSKGQILSLKNAGTGGG